jgi:hypothetical protein
LIEIVDKNDRDSQAVRVRNIGLARSANPVDPMEWLPRNPGTLLTVIPARDNQLLAIVGYLLPPKPQPSQPLQPPLRLPGASQASGELVVDRDHYRVLLAGREIELVFRSSSSLTS